MKHIIEKALQNVTGEPEVYLEYPADPSHGDYASSVALKLAKDKKQNPRDVAQTLAEALSKDTNLTKSVSKIEVAGPGFINFTIANEALEDVIVTMADAPRGLLVAAYEGKKIMVEFTDPNPFKEFHIGHLYSNSVGESIARLFELSGATVVRACYQGDVGMHVAKSIWGLTKKLESDGIDLSVLSKKSLVERIHYIGQAYATGSTAYEDNPEAAEEIKLLNKKIYEKDSSIIDLYTMGRSWSLEYFESIYKRVGTKFDYYYFESEVGSEGVRIVMEYLDKGVFEKSQEAIVFPGEKYGLHTRVFINKLGLPTYEAKELALAPRKYSQFPYDMSVIVTANEIAEYFKVLLKALSLIEPELASKTRHIPHGFVRLPEGKMSSRKGTIISGETLLDEAVNRVKKVAQESGSTPSDETMEMVGLAAVKYALLKNTIGGNITFSFEESVAIHGNSGVYLEYTIARALSVSKKGSLGGTNQADSMWGSTKEEQALMHILPRFYETIEDAAKNYSPSTVATYLYALANAYNTFYAACPIVGSEFERSRITLTKATAEALKIGLYALGIPSVTSM